MAVMALAATAGGSQFEPLQPSIPSAPANLSRSVSFADDWRDHKGGKKVLAETQSFEVPQSMCWSYTFDLGFGDNT